MKTFDEIYEELQSADNSELNSAWQEAKKESEKAKRITMITCLVINVIAFIIILILLSNGLNLEMLLPTIVPILIVNIFAIVIINIIFSKNRNNYSAKYKQIVINKLINNFYNNVEYFPQKPMPEYIYKDLEYEYYNRYNSEDYLEAQINNGNSIQMAEILTQEEETYKDSDGNTKTRTITKFYGLFAKIVMDKSIMGELKIMQNGTMLFGNKLKMDSSEFEKYFDVQASNKIIGMQLLTADIMEELVRFVNETNMKYDVYIKEKELYLRFHSGEMFEAGNIKSGVLDRKLIHKYFYMLNFTYNLSNKIINLVKDTQI